METLYERRPREVPRLFRFVRASDPSRLVFAFGEGWIVRKAGAPFWIPAKLWVTAEILMNFNDMSENVESQRLEKS